MRENIKLLIMDVDGTLTDGKIYIGNNGEIMKAFDIKDGCGIHDILPLYGIIPVIITGRQSSILEIRCKELGIKYLYQGIKNKITKLDELLKLLNDNGDRVYSYKNIAYIGDDINDLSCMKPIKKAGGIIACPADAVKEVKDISNYISCKIGGNGAVRDFIEWILDNSDTE